jgi:glycosyltransferase involved in cell wall biosynthesis
MQVVYSFAIGGSEMVARDIALGLVKAGWPASVCALEHDGILREELNAQGVDTVVIAKRGREIIGPMFRLWKAFRSFQPDVVHTHHFYELFYAWPGALLCGARIIHTEHEFHSLKNGRVKRRLRRLAILCHKVTAVNDDTAVYLREVVGIPAHKVVTVGNGIDVERFKGCGDVREMLGLEPSFPVAGIVARLEAPKNHALLLRAFCRLLQQIPEARLLIVGDGSLRGKMEHLADDLGIHDHTLFLGARRDIPELLASMDVVALSSDLEGLPIAILEAMAAGRPVVATGAGGIGAVVRHCETGLLVRPGDEAGLAASLATVIGDRVLARRMGENGQRFVMEHYAFKRVLRQYQSLYSTQAK